MISIKGVSEELPLVELWLLHAPHIHVKASKHVLGLLEHVRHVELLLRHHPVGVDWLSVLGSREEHVEEAVDVMVDLFENMVHASEDDVHLLVDESHELVEFMEDGVEESVGLWEVHLDDVLDLHVASLSELMHHGSEGGSLHVLLLTILVPLQLETSEVRHHLTKVVSKSTNLSNLLGAVVAGIIGVKELVEVDRGTNDLNGIVNDSIFHALTVEASLLVFDAPVGPVVIDALDVTGVLVLGNEVHGLDGDLLVLGDWDGERVFLDLLPEGGNLVVVVFHPGAEAVVAENVFGFLVVASVELLEPDLGHSSHGLEGGELVLLVDAAELRSIEQVVKLVSVMLVVVGVGGGGTKQS